MGCCSWEDICQPKENGGLGIRDLFTVIKSLITHAAGNIAINKNPFLTSILKAKYFHSNSFWMARADGPRSIFWSSILQIKNDLVQNVIYQIHNGNTSIWSSPWCQIWNTIHDHLLLPVTHSPLPSVVSDLWIPNTHIWNMDLLSTIFDPQAVQIISQVVTVDSQHQDILRWTPARKGDCSTKNIYRFLRSQDQVQLPLTGSRSLQQQANQILQRMWKLKNLPPLIKTFTWRLIRRALATGCQAARYSTHIDEHCSVCGLTETDAHLFFHCDFARAVWFSATPPLRADTTK